MKIANRIVATLSLTVFVLHSLSCTSTSISDSQPSHPTTIPKRFHGTWTPHSTGVHPSGGESAWIITAKSIQGHESYGEVSSVAIHGDGAITVYEDVVAEGMKYNSEITYRISPDGSTLEVKPSEGGTFKLYRVLR